MNHSSDTPNSDALVEHGLRFSVVSLLVNTAMGILKFGVGAFSGSQALIVGALYSVNDALAAIAVNVSLRFSHRRPDKMFPFGYERAEHLATATTGIVLAVAVTGVFLYQVKDILTLHKGPAHINAVGVAVLSVFVSGVLHRRGEHLAHELGSPALHTSAEHSKADSISSIAVLVGVGAAALDFHLIDRMVAVFEIGHIVVLAGEFLLHSARGLQDLSLPEEDEALAVTACIGVAGVKGVAQLRSRSGGRTRWVNVVVMVADDLPVSEAHAITVRVAKAINGALGEGVQARVGFQSAA